MYNIEHEIRDQFNAIDKTIDQVLSQKEEICTLLSKVRSLLVIGCGSSFSVAKSTAMQFAQYSGIPAYPLPAGDLLVNFEDYGGMLSDAAILSLSRSGSTSEAVRAAERSRKEFGCPVISVCAVKDSPIEPVADVNVIIPWAFDEAVCQSRTVTNLYIAGLVMAALKGGREDLIQAVKKLHPASQEFAGPVEELAREYAEKGWSKAVVLCDSAAAGLAEEGALAFKEICRRDSNHYHLLDVRHGPMVKIDENTLVVAYLSKGDFGLQADLIKDVAKRTDCLLVCSAVAEAEQLDGKYVRIPDCGADVVNAVFMQYCIQLITMYHAFHRGVNPDSPEGLDAWIKL
ncbi:MAG: SIS domain-containing protein [Lachnospiraceae bacterium]|nr:SIS domain-containing protein [Lachnospiraceae bacterium]